MRTGRESTDATTLPTCSAEGPTPRVTRAQGVSENQRAEVLLTDYAHQLTGGGGKPGQGYPAVLISSTEDSHAKTCPSPEDEQDSLDPDPASSMSSLGSLTLFDPPGCSSRTYPASSPRTMVGTSESFWGRWPNSGTAALGECSTHATSEYPSDAAEYSLSAILEGTVDPRYMLSVRAAAGVLRRADVRGRILHPTLMEALRRIVGTSSRIR